MTHDPLCPCKPQVIGHGSTSGDVQAAAPAVACQCDLIAKARQQGADSLREQVRMGDWPAQQQDAYERGQRDMLAKCIAELEALMAKTDGDRFHGFWDFIAALRALEDKP